MKDRVAIFLVPFVVLTFCFSAPKVKAQILADEFYSDAYVFDYKTVQPNFIPLSGLDNKDVADRVTFNMAKPGTVKLTFTSSCSIYGSSDNLTWVDIDIIIDNKINDAVVPTKGINDGFCGSQKQLNLKTRASITVYKALNAGKHTVKVIGKISPASPNYAGAQLSNSTMLVEQ